MPAPPKRAKEVEKAKALARHSVGYCSGSQRVYTAKLAPPKPRKNRTYEKPREGRRAQVEDFAKGDGDEGRHQGEIQRERAAAAETFGEGRHSEAAKHGGERDEHDRVGGELRGLLRGRGQRLQRVR